MAVAWGLRSVHWIGLGGVGVLEIVGTATKLICPAEIWPVAVGPVE